MVTKSVNIAKIQAKIWAIQTRLVVAVIRVAEITQMTIVLTGVITTVRRVQGLSVTIPAGTAK